MLLERIQEHDQRLFDGIAFHMLHEKFYMMNNTFDDSIEQFTGCCELQNFLCPIYKKAEALLDSSSVNISRLFIRP